MIGNPKRNRNETRPDAESIAGILLRKQVVAYAEADVAAVTSRTHPRAILKLVPPLNVIEKAAPIVMPSEIASNVISLAAKQEEKVAAQVLAQLTEQEQRVADARNLVKAAA